MLPMTPKLWTLIEIQFIACILVIQLLLSHILYSIWAYKRNLKLMIKSSFKKLDKGAPSQRCCFGHPDLDAIFTNSLSKGHLMIIEEDHPSTNYLALCRYFLSNHYAQGLTSIVYDSSPRWKYLISPPLKREEKQKAQGKSQIAWRYDQMNIKLNHLSLDERIAFTDLSKEVTAPKEDLLRLNQYPSGSVRQLYTHIQQSYVNSQADEKDTSTKKLLLASLPAYCYQDKEFSGFLKAIRCLTRSSHLFTLITVPPILSVSTRNKLIKHADYYLTVSRVAKGYEDFSGSLTVLKQVQSSSLRSLFRGSSVWGLKTTRKQVRLEALYEQPVEGENEGNKEHDF